MAEVSIALSAMDGIAIGTDMPISASPDSLEKVRTLAEGCLVAMMYGDQAASCRILQGALQTAGSVPPGILRAVKVLWPAFKRVCGEETASGLVGIALVGYTAAGRGMGVTLRAEPNRAGELAVVPPVWMGPVAVAGYTDVARFLMAKMFYPGWSVANALNMVAFAITSAASVHAELASGVALGILDIGRAFEWLPSERIAAILRRNDRRSHRLSLLAASYFAGSAAIREEPLS